MSGLQRMGRETGVVSGIGKATVDRAKRSVTHRGVVDGGKTRHRGQGHGGRVLGSTQPVWCVFSPLHRFRPWETHFSTCLQTYHIPSPTRPFLADDLRPDCTDECSPQYRLPPSRHPMKEFQAEAARASLSQPMCTLSRFKSDRAMIR